MQTISYDNLGAETLETVLGNYKVYRDKYCNGWARLTIKEFYLRFGLKEFVLTGETKKYIREKI